MIQREDIALLVGTAGGVALVALGHTTEGLYLIAAGGIGKAIIPQIAPSIVATPSVLAGTIVTVNGKNYITQPDGSLKPQ